MKERDRVARSSRRVHDRGSDESGSTKKQDALWRGGSRYCGRQHCASFGAAVHSGGVAAPWPCSSPADPASCGRNS